MAKITITVDPNNHDSVRDAFVKVLGLPPGSDGAAILDAAAAILSGAPGALPPLPPETVDQLARLHGLKPREVTMCRQLGVSLAAYCNLRSQQRTAAAARR